MSIHFQKLTSICRFHSSLSRSHVHENFFVVELQRINGSKSISEARNLHRKLVEKGELERNPYLLNHVAEMYANCNSLEEARSTFERIPQPASFTWNALIAANARNRELQEAKRLFDSQPNRSMLSSTSMVSAYAKAGYENEAISIFNNMSVKGILAWNAIISMYAEKGNFAEAKAMFERMPNPNVVSRNIILTGYGHFGRLEEAKKLFDAMEVRTVVTWNTMITAYCQNACVHNARVLFEQMVEKNVISWNTMISGYCQNGHAKQALQLFIIMDLEGVQPNKFTFCSALDACANLSYFVQGKLIHEDIEASGNDDVAIENSLANMYGKCGKMNIAMQVFQRMKCPDVVSWTGMVAAYAQNGFSPQALKMFRAMVQNGIRPNEVTLINTISACSHGGLFKEGALIFSTLTAGEYGGLRVTRDHFLCMIDLLGRAGSLEGAENLLERMPYEGGEVAWTSLLSACKTHHDSERAARIAKAMDGCKRKKDPGPYVILSNIYSAKLQR